MTKCALLKNNIFLLWIYRPDRTTLKGGLSLVVLISYKHVNSVPKNLIAKRLSCYDMGGIHDESFVICKRLGFA